MERAAIMDGDADVVVAAESVVPRQPIDEHRRLIFEERQMRRDHRLVRAQHALRVDHALGHARRAGGEEEFRDRVGRGRANGRRRRRRLPSLDARSAKTVALRWAGSRSLTTISASAARRPRSRAKTLHRPRRKRVPASASREYIAACRNPTTSANRRPRWARKGCRHAWPRGREAHARCRCPRE